MSSKLNRLLVVLAMATPLLASTAGPSAGRTIEQVADAGRISFTTKPPANPDDTYVFTMRSDGSGKRKLLPTHTCCAGWSPDGTRLVVPRATKDDRIASAIVRRDGSHYRKLPLSDPTLNIGCTSGSWSPTSAQLTCESWDETNAGRNGLYTISARDGRIVRRLTRNPFGATDIPGSYSPDGKRIVFVRFRGEDDATGLYVVHADGHGLRRIDAARARLNGGADWSPDGRDIAFSRHVTADARGSLWIIHPDGSGLRPLVPEGLACGGDVDAPRDTGCHAPVWSPDGTRIAFAAGNDAVGYDIYTVNSDGTDLTRLTTTGADDPDWSAGP